MSAFTPTNMTRIEEIDQLKEFMLARCKTPEQWKIGTEHEKFGYSYNTNSRPQFKGEIEEIFFAYEQQGWQATREKKANGEEGAIISLNKNQASITLEPGGQLELSGAPLKTLAEMATELDEHLNSLRQISEPLGLIWSGLGSDPTTPAETPKMPKARYGVMRSYLPTRGQLALHMMHSTCTIQTNLDYANEADAMQKLRLGLYLQPIVMALFANSFLLDGQLRSGVCARSQIWLHTDPDRYLYPAEWLYEHTPIQSYIEWALSVPMFFIAREGQYIDCSGLPFKEFMQKGFQGHQATIGDFELHLSTLFPDTRLKQHFEVRGADMSSPDYIRALAAFHVGLMYDESSFNKALAHFEAISADELWQARAQVDELGLQTQLAEKSFQNHGLHLIELASEGLSRWEPDSVYMLDHLYEQVSRGLCPADTNKQLWEKGYKAMMEGTRLA